MEWMARVNSESSIGVSRQQLGLFQVVRTRYTKLSLVHLFQYRVG